LITRRRLRRRLLLPSKEKKKGTVSCYLVFCEGKKKKNPTKKNKTKQKTFCSFDSTEATEPRLAGKKIRNHVFIAFGSESGEISGLAAGEEVQ
jgi:hypothetical protein